MRLGATQDSTLAILDVFLNNAKLQRPIAPKLRGVSGTQSSGLESSGIVLSSGEIAEFITPSV